MTSLVDVDRVSRTDIARVSALYPYDLKTHVYQYSHPIAKPSSGETKREARP